jgi:hypothetical protein
MFSDQNFPALTCLLVNMWIINLGTCKYYRERVTWQHSNGLNVMAISWDDVKWLKLVQDPVKCCTSTSIYKILVHEYFTENKSND